MSINNKYLFFALIIIANVILKSFFLDATPFWYDEMISVKDTQLDFGHIKHEAEWDNNPPFYYYCLWVWHSVIPVSEFNSRFLSVLFVAFAIGLFYLFARKYFDNKTAIASSIFLTLSNFILFYSQETRAYSLVLLLAVISTIQFFKYINEPKLFNLILLSLISFLIIYTHYLAGLIVFIQYLIILFFHKKKYVSFFGIQSLIIIGLILLRFTKKQFLNILNFNKKDDFWLEPAGFKDLVSGISELFYNPATAVVFMIVLLFFTFTYFTNKVEDVFRVKLYCLILGFFSIFFLFIIGSFKPMFLPRYLIFCVPFATLLFTHQLFSFKKIGSVMIILLIGFEMYSINLIKKGPSDYRALANVVKENKKENDIVIINTKDNLGLFLYYSYDRFLNYKAFDSICSANNIFAVNDTEGLSKINYQKNANIFLIQSFHNIKNNDNPIEKHFISRNKKVFSTKFYKGIEFSVFAGL
ncbi:MAG: glycosyltransferase family 39 protein [Bacteroidota bacterium]|nr:glycosyltransferase family 39 protein [Bacteroidota bacterium]